MTKTVFPSLELHLLVTRLAQQTSCWLPGCCGHIRSPVFTNACFWPSLHLTITCDLGNQIAVGDWKIKKHINLRCECKRDAWRSVSKLFFGGEQTHALSPACEWNTYPSEYLWDSQTQINFYSYIRPGNALLCPQHAAQTLTSRLTGLPSSASTPLISSRQNPSLQTRVVWLSPVKSSWYLSSCIPHKIKKFSRIPMSNCVLGEAQEKVMTVADKRIWKISLNMCGLIKDINLN